ncbi:sensor histidine kinase [Aquipuribacter sp. SD81]|uniref:sensor histidine kinase n=1 Tax=Aquipuribacter sp. SD81 TaxID=3127703 RepID=UPI00301ADA47
MSLRVRLTVTALVVMALTLLAVAVVTWRLVAVAERADVDTELRQELAQVGARLPEDISGAVGADGSASAAELQLAARRYLATSPGGGAHLLVLDLGGSPFAAADGPPDLLALRDAGEVPVGEPGRIVTVGTSQGDVRVLSAPLRTADGVTVGTATVLGSLADARARTASVLWRTALAGGAGLLLGGLVLLVAVRRELVPLRDLAVAAGEVGGTPAGPAGTGAPARRVPQPERLDEVGVVAQEFNAMVDRLDRSAEERRQLLSAVSHEMRTPLTVARGHLEAFETTGGDDAAAARGTALVVRRELDRLARVLADLTALTAGEARSVRQEPVFVPDVLDALRERLAGLGLDGVDVGDAPPVVLSGDEDRLAQCLLNLVVNARTHTPPETPVRVRASAGDGVVRLVVEDDGPGIDPEVRDRVFEPFVTTRPGGGSRTSGLGLAVVRSLVEAQGGTAELDDVADGTRVVLTLVADDGTGVDEDGPDDG